MRTKISGTGWLCVWNTATSQWIAVFELTKKQLEEYGEAIDLLEQETNDTAEAS